MRRGKDVSACEKADQRSLRWFGHVERMEEEKFVKRVSVRVLGVRRRRGTQVRCWMSGVI